MVVAASGAGVGLLLLHARRLPALVDQAAAAYDRGEWSTAATLAEDLVKLTPDDRRALRLLARASIRLGRDQRRDALYARLGGATAMEAEDYYLFGGVISRLDDRETARECWEQGLRIDPNHAGLLFELAGLFRRMSRYSAAVKLASHLSTLPGWEARGKLLLGQIKYEQDDAEGSAADLRRPWISIRRGRAPSRRQPNTTSCWHAPCYGRDDRPMRGASCRSS